MRSCTTTCSALLCLALAACGKGKDAPPAATAPAAGSGVTGDGVTPAAPTPVLPELGVDQVRRFNYAYGDGAAAFGKANAAYKAKPRDWAGVRSHGEQALAKDPYHLGARRLVAAALAQDGDYRGAATHLLAALAADWLSQSVSLESDPDLAGLLASPTGAELRAAAAQLRATFAQRASAGVLLLGRRSAFKLPDKAGAQAASPRGELYAYDRTSKRYLRLSQTDHTVAAALRSPSGRELVLLGFDKLELPSAAGDGGTALLGRAFALVVDASTFAPLGKRVALPKALKLAVGYGRGERLLAATLGAGAWPQAAAQWLALDIATGKTASSQPAELERAVIVSALDGAMIDPPPGLAATPSDGDVVASLVASTGTAIEIPDAPGALRSSLSVAPDGAHLAFAAAPDPCVAAPSLFIAETKTGALKHVLTGKSWFRSRWLDASTLAYEDQDGAVRLYDATLGREVARLTERGGLALNVLASARGPSCASAPAAAAAGDGSDGSDAADEGAAPPPAAPADAESEAGPQTRPTP
jgi:hypothetical protein